jgi:hypothetical protein
VAHATRDEIRRATEPGIRWFRDAAMWVRPRPTDLVFLFKMGS